MKIFAPFSLAFALLLLLPIATCAQTSPVYDQSSWASGQSATDTLDNTLPDITPVGALLLVWIDWDCGPQDVNCEEPRTFQSIWDDAGNEYTQLGDEQGYLGDLGVSDTTRLYYAVNQVAGVRTVSFAVSSDQGAFNGSFVMQYHGQDQANPIDNVTWTSYLHADGLSDPSATVSTSGSNETVVSIVSGGGLTSPHYIGNSFTIQWIGDGNVFPFGLADTPISGRQDVTAPWFSNEVQGWGLWSVALNAAQ